MKNLVQFEQVQLKANNTIIELRSLDQKWTGFHNVTKVIDQMETGDTLTFTAAYWDQVSHICTIKCEAGTPGQNRYRDTSVGQITLTADSRAAIEAAGKTPVTNEDKTIKMAEIIEIASKAGDAVLKTL